MVLHEWAVHILRMRDLRKKEIESIDNSDSSLLLVKKKDGHILKMACVKKISYDAQISHYFCDNTKDNVRRLYEEWALFSSNKDCKVTFVNTNGSFWTIIPYNHAKITLAQKVLPGLESLYNTSKI